MEDFSIEYLEMCEKATELQEKWQPKVGQSYCKKGEWNNDEVRMISIDLLDDEIETFKTDYFWTPFTNEIHGMMAGAETQNFEKRIYNQFIKKLDDIDPLIRDLMYAMHRICGKKWNSEDKIWIRQ